MKQNVGAVAWSNGRFRKTTPLGNTMTEKHKDWKPSHSLPYSLSFYGQLSHPDQHSLLFFFFFYYCAAAGGRWQMNTNWQQTKWQASDKPSLLIPVYSKWKPAADTLMSDWKVKYRLLDVLFSSWGIVVPVLYNIQKTVKTISGPYQRFKPTKDMWTCTTHEHILHLSYIQYRQ